MKNLFTPENAALFLIDHQVGTMQLIKNLDVEAVKRNTLALAKEEMSRRRMEKGGVVLTATNTVIAELAQNWSTEAGSQLIQLLFQEVLPKIG